MSVEILVALFAAFIGGGGVSAVLVKRLNKPVDAASAAEKEATARKTDVDNLRAIIAEVRESEARKAARIDALEQRLERLEERERHALTRAAVHEAWDQLAFQRIVMGDAHFPPPPPLTGPTEDEQP